MEEQKKNRKRKMIQKTKSPELVRSVKRSSSAEVSYEMHSNSAIQQFQSLWK